MQKRILPPGAYSLNYDNRRDHNRRERKGEAKVIGNDYTENSYTQF